MMRTGNHVVVLRCGKDQRKQKFDTDG
jgi:hypothetical protein